MKTIKNKKIFKKIKTSLSFRLLALGTLGTLGALNASMALGAAGEHPPYAGTVYVVPNTLTPSDPSAFLSTQYLTKDDKNWIFSIQFDDGTSMQALISNAFSSQALARKEVDKLSYALGQLPLLHRREVEKVYVAAGEGRAFAKIEEKAFYLMSQSNNARLQGGHLEELLLHEATHVALDPHIRNTKGWVAAQEQDNAFISTYARDNFAREDIAETFGLYLTYRYKKDRLTAQERQNIERTMSARMQFLDSLNLDVYPFVEQEEGSGFLLSPPPRSMLTPYDASIKVKGTDGVKYYDLLVGTQGPGSDNIRSSAVQSTETFNVQNLPINGETVYVRLWTNKNGWQFKDYTYLANRPSAQATLSSHADGDVLTSTTVTFKWDNVERAGSYDMLVGTQGYGSTNLMATNVDPKASRVLNNIPLDGSAVYVRLWTHELNWSYVDYRFDTANGTIVRPTAPPVTTNPAPAPKPVSKPKPKPKPIAAPKPVAKPKPQPAERTYNGIKISEGLYNLLKRIGLI